MIDFEEARNEVKAVASSLAGVVDSVVKPCTAELDKLITKISTGIDKFSNNDLRDLMARISVETYYIGIAKEQSSLRDACANALYKEGMAKVYAATQGAVEAKKQQSIIDTVDKQAVSILYTTVAGLLRTKVDEAHRIVSVINSVLISRAAEAKQFYNPRNEQDTLNINE